MIRAFSVTGAVLGLVTASCGGLTQIGEVGDAGAEDSGGTGGTGTGGNGGASGSGGGSGGANGGRSGGTGSGGDATGGTGTGGTGTGGSSGGGTGTGALPCDVLEGAGHACVAAHSTVRVLVSGYTGNLYRLERSDSETLDIGVVDGFADVAAHDAFCTASSCTFAIIYDQSPFGNHLTPAPPGGAKSTPGRPANAMSHRVNINGRSVFGILFRPGQGYRAACNDCLYPEGPTALPVDDEPQTAYMVSSQHDLINGCCFDYGNGEVTQNNDGEGATEAVYLGEGVIWGSGVDYPPWVMADLENGLYPGWDGDWDKIATNTGLPYDFVTAMLVGDTADKNGGKGRFALYGGDASAGTLKTMYDGIRPELGDGYVPMRKQGSVILSIAGDNSDGDGGRFYEGVIARGAATQETVGALQAAIVAAGYGR